MERYKLVNFCSGTSMCYFSCWSYFVCLHWLISFLFLFFREYWMSNSCSFSSFKMRAPQTLSLRLLISISMSPRSSWGTSEDCCEFFFAHTHTSALHLKFWFSLAGLLDGLIFWSQTFSPSHLEVTIYNTFFFKQLLGHNKKVLSKTVKDFIILIINCKNFVSLEFYLFIWLKIKVMEQDG